MMDMYQITYTHMKSRVLLASVMLATVLTTTLSTASATLIGSGTVANEDTAMGSSCLAEKRTLEQINQGEIKTPFMKENDTIEIEMKNAAGASIFGRIFQKVKKVN